MRSPSTADSSNCPSWTKASTKRSKDSAAASSSQTALSPARIFESKSPTKQLPRRQAGDPRSANTSTTAAATPRMPSTVAQACPSASGTASSAAAPHESSASSRAW